MQCKMEKKEQDYKIKQLEETVEKLQLIILDQKAAAIDNQNIQTAQDEVVDNLMKSRILIYNV